MELTILINAIEISLGGIGIMGKCNHCDGSGRCEDDFHSGGGFLGGEDSAGQNHPGLFESTFGHCPSCNDGNTEWRPACPHCAGTGEDDPGPLSSAKPYLGLSASRKERERNERQSQVESSEASHSSNFGDWLEDGFWSLATLGSKMQEPTFPKPVNYLLVATMPLSVLIGVLWYISEVIYAYDSGGFEVIPAFLLAWIAIPLCMVGGLLSVLSVYLITKLGVSLTNRKSQ
jgi:hypothetical protein